jgi:hypothetical protein
MANLTNYTEEALLALLLKATAFSSPATVYAALISDAANDANMEAGLLTNEITAYDGNRPSVTFGDITQNGEGEAECKNTNLVSYANMPATTVKYIAIMDGNTKSAGNMLLYGELITPRTTLLGDPFQFPIGDITVRMK